MVTKDLPISPRFTTYVFLSRCKFSNHTSRQPMVEFYLLAFPRFPLRKKEHKSYFGKNRTHNFCTSRCAGYLLDHSGDEQTVFFVSSLISLIADGPYHYHSACGHLRIFPSLPGSRLTIFYRDASSALLRLVNQWLKDQNLRESDDRAIQPREYNLPYICCRADLCYAVLYNGWTRNYQYRD